MPTRTFELAVHSLDIASSAALPVSIPEVVLADAAALAARVGAETGQAVTVLRALTGRARLPSDFSVLLREDVGGSLTGHHRQASGALLVVAKGQGVSSETNSA